MRWCAVVVVGFDCSLFLVVVVELWLWWCGCVLAVLGIVRRGCGLLSGLRCLVLGFGSWCVAYSCYFVWLRFGGLVGCFCAAAVGLVVVRVVGGFSVFPWI